VVLGKFWHTDMADPYYQYGLELGGDGRLRFYIGSATGLLAAAMDTSLVLNQWSHVGIVFNGAEVRFYVNGTLVTTKPMAGTITARDSDLYIGADANPWQYFKGMLDDVRVYNRSRTAADVQADMNTGL
jgi:hypothetical protein